MVVRLEGEINGESVVLYRNKDSPGSPEIWDAVIPATLNGKYVIGPVSYTHLEESYLLDYHADERGGMVRRESVNASGYVTCLLYTSLRQEKQQLQHLNSLCILMMQTRTS